MSKQEDKESPEVEARWKEFWGDHRDYNLMWVRDFLMQLRENLPYVFGNSSWEAFVLMYQKCGVELPPVPRQKPYNDDLQAACYIAACAPEVLPARELYKLPIAKFALAVRAYAYYGLMPDWLDDPDRGFDDYLPLFGTGFFSNRWDSRGYEELRERYNGDEKEIEDRFAILAASGRWKLDDDSVDELDGITPEQLAALARVSRKSIMNLLAPGSGGVLQSNSAKLITRESSRRWLLGRPDFRPSIWQQQKGKSVWSPNSEASSIDEPLFVPVARDGSWFSPTDCHQADGQYHVGNGADEMTFKDYRLALDFLTRAASPRWRYTDTIGRWRTKTATSWERKARHEVISVSSEGRGERTKRAGRKA